MKSTQETIAFGVSRTILGNLLIAKSGSGICAVYLGDSVSALRDELRRDFPDARIKRDDAATRSDARVVSQTIENPRRKVSVKLDLRGTDFQRKVWRELCRIPSGRTITYSELAKRVGSPRAVRAAGSACGANLISLLVPCHRVVRSGGAISGYRWGAERKRKLLAIERAAVTELR